MKKQSGFTLIELLLVVAIIGIISVIAIPKLMGLKDGAKDNAAQANLDSIMTSFVAEYTKAEKDDDAFTTDAGYIKDYIVGKSVSDTNGKIPEIWSARNPWNIKEAELAYQLSETVITATNPAAYQTALIALAKPTNKGQVQLAVIEYNGSLSVGGAVYLNKSLVKGSAADKDHVMCKVVGLG